MYRKNKLRDRKLREREQRADEILTAAGKVFFTKGFLKTTMDEIAYEAGISKPTIYKFFPTKEDLYFSLLIPELQEWLHNIEEINVQLQLNMYSSGEKLLRDVMNVFLKNYNKNPELFRIGELFQQAGKLWTIDKKIDSSIRILSRAVTGEMRSLYDNAVTQGIMRDLDRYSFTEVLLGSIFGIIQLHDARLQGGNEEHKLEVIIDAAVDLFSGSIVLK